MDDHTDDNIIDINFDDEDEQRDDAGFLDVTLDSERPMAPVTPAVPAPPGGPSTPPPPEDPDDDVPMTSGGACPRCGFALRPLEQQCPRCARLGSVSASPPAPPPAPADAPGSAPPEESYPAARRSGCLQAALIGGVILFLLIIVATAIWLHPSQRAKREYQLGIQAQARAEFEVARAHYQMALDLNPNMGLAAFSMGTTYLLLGDPAMIEGVKKLTERAAQGDTRDLDQADGWFRRALEIGESLPPTTRLLDRRIQTPSKLRAFARASLALTAFLRAAAALDAEAFDDAMAWLEVAQREAQAAMVDDPTNAAAERIIRSVTPAFSPPGDVR